MTAEERPISAKPDDNYSSIERYTHLKRELIECIDAMLRLEHVAGGRCLEIREKLLANVFNLVVVGQFKRGKTCLINALIGTNLLPVAVVPLTSIVTILKFGDALAIKVFFNDGTTKEIESDSLSDYVTESGNPRNEKDVREVVISFPSPYLSEGVRLIDTPGVGSAYIHNTDVAYRYLPRSDAALFLLSVEQPASKAELDFLKDVRQYSSKIFFLLNKIDYLSDSDIRESIAFSRQILRDAMGSDVKIFPISAKMALQGKMSGEQDLLGKSLLPSFSEVLNAFLLHEKGKFLLLSTTNSLLRVLSQSRLQLELEQKSLTTPIEEVEEKIRLFERKKQDAMIEKQHFEMLLDGEVNKLIKNTLDLDLASFKENFTHEMELRFDAFCGENKDIPLNELNASIESFVTSEVEQAFAAWYSDEEEKVASGFESVCGIFLSRINEIIDALLDFSSQLFSVPFERVESENLWTAESSFYFKLAEQPVGLEILENSMTGILPGLVLSRFARLKAYLFTMARQRIYGRRREHMVQSIDMQAGRMRYHLVSRLHNSKLNFRREMLEKIDATVEGIDSAIEKGMQKRAQGEKEARERITALFEELSKMDQAKDALIRISERVTVV